MGDIEVECNHCFGSGGQHPGSPEGDRGCSLCGGTGKRYITSEEASRRILQDKIDKLQGTTHRRHYWDQREEVDSDIDVKP